VGFPSNARVEWSAFLLCIREVPDSNIGPEAILAEILRGFRLSLQENFGVED
jgi:hypothetical protein